jgi:hypothetical protein
MDTLFDDLFYLIIDKLPQKEINKELYIPLFTLKLVSKKSYSIIKKYCSRKKYIYNITIKNFIRNIDDFKFFGININHFNLDSNYIKLLSVYNSKYLKKILKKLNLIFYTNQYSSFNNITEYFLSLDFPIKKRFLIENNNVHPNFIKLMSNNIEKKDRFIFDCLTNQEFKGNILPKIIEYTDIFETLNNDNSFDNNITKLNKIAKLDYLTSSKFYKADYIKKIGSLCNKLIKQKKFNIVKFILKNLITYTHNSHNYDFLFDDIKIYKKSTKFDDQMNLQLAVYIQYLILNLDISDIKLFDDYLDLELVSVFCAKTENIKLFDFYLENEKIEKLYYLIYFFKSNNFKNNNIILNKLISIIDDTDLISSLVQNRDIDINDYQKEIILSYYLRVKKENLNIQNDIDLSFELIIKNNTYDTYINYLYEIGFRPSEISKNKIMTDRMKKIYDISNYSWSNISREEILEFIGKFNKL